MTVDCQWIEKNLEAFFCDRLNVEESRLAQAHVETCADCRGEIQALRAIDPLIKNHFRRQLAVAHTGRARHVRPVRVFGLAGVVTAVIVALLVVFLRVPQSQPVAVNVSSAENTSPGAAAATPKPIKAEDEPEILRAKPTEAAPAPDRRPAAPPAITASAPEFLVADPAGYEHGLDEYRGRVVVIGVWGSDQNESIGNLERLYKTNAANPKFRLLGVSNDRLPKPANTTFPIFYNQGSKLFGANAGEFVLLNENGAPELKGSLVEDFEALTAALKTK